MGTINLKTRVLPYAYEQLEYVQSSGTQYIDTGVAFDSSTDKVVAEFFSSETGNYKWSFGAYVSPNGIGITSGNNWSLDLFYYTAYTVSSSLLKNTKHTFTADTNGCYVDTTKVSSYISFSIANTLYLFGCNTGSESSANRSSSTIYSFKFYRNNVLLRDFIPARRIYDSVVGMYDTVTETFYTNAGTGTFTAGEVVKTVDALTISNKDVKQLSINNKVFWNKYTIPSTYTQKSYLQSSGEQYLNSGVYATGTTRVIVDFKYNDTTSQSHIFGYSKNYQDGTTGSAVNMSAYINGNGYFAYACNYGETGNWVSSGIYKNTNRHTLDFNMKEGYYQLDTTKKTFSTVSGSSGGLPLYIFALARDNGTTGGQSGTLSKANIYSMKMYEDDVLVRDFIPAVRNSDSVAGMYDKVTDTFYTNAGTGTFITD